MPAILKRMLPWSLPKKILTPGYVATTLTDVVPGSVRYIKLQEFPFRPMVKAVTV